MGSIDGKIRLLYIKRTIDADFRRVGFLTVNAWQRSTTTVPTTTRNNAGFATAMPVENSSVISFSLVVKEDADLVGKVGYKELIEIQDNREQIEWKLEAANKSLSQEGFGHLTSLNEQAAVNEEVLLDGTIPVFGRPMDVSDTEPPTTPILSLRQQGSFGDEILLFWTASTDNVRVAGYQILKSQGKNNEIIDVGNVTDYTDLSVVQSTFYSYNVRAYDLRGNFSDWSNKRFVTIPIPSGQPPANYLLQENGSPIYEESGVPLTV